MAERGKPGHVGGVEWVSAGGEMFKGGTYEQIDYVPTQIVTEYLLRIFGNGALVDGLLYASALTGRVSAVLDVPASRCAGQVTGWDAGAELRFGLVQDSVEMRKLTSAEKGA